MPDNHGADHPTYGRDIPPTGTEPVTVAEASRRLRISRNAVVQRRKRGTLYARQDGGTWLYWIPAEAGVVGRDHPRPGADQPPPTTPTSAADHPATGDVSALVALVDRLVRENVDLHATAAVLQERNAVLSERLLALESGAATSPTASTPDPADTPAAEPALEPSVMAVDARDGGHRDDDTRDKSAGLLGRLKDFLSWG